MTTLDERFQRLVETAREDPEVVGVAMIGAIVETGDAAPQQRLLGVIDAVARERGCGDVITSWGEKYEWMRTSRPDRGRE
jgi:hypothetical protein